MLIRMLVVFILSFTSRPDCRSCQHEMACRVGVEESEWRPVCEELATQVKQSLTSNTISLLINVMINFCNFIFFYLLIK